MISAGADLDADAGWSRAGFEVRGPLAMQGSELMRMRKLYQKSAGSSANNPAAAYHRPFVTRKLAGS